VLSERQVTICARRANRYSGSCPAMIRSGRASWPRGSEPHALGGRVVHTPACDRRASTATAESTGRGGRVCSRGMPRGRSLGRRRACPWCGRSRDGRSTPPTPEWGVARCSLDATPTRPEKNLLRADGCLRRPRARCRECGRRVLCRGNLDVLDVRSRLRIAASREEAFLLATRPGVALAEKGVHRDHQVAVSASPEQKNPLLRALALRLARISPNLIRSECLDRCRCGRSSDLIRRIRRTSCARSGYRICAGNGHDAAQWRRPETNTCGPKESDGSRVVWG
jgi:hypothetical protein